MCGCYIVGSVQLGVQTLPYLYSSELFPTDIRAMCKVDSKVVVNIKANINHISVEGGHCMVNLRKGACIKGARKKGAHIKGARKKGDRKKGAK